MFVQVSQRRAVNTALIIDVCIGRPDSDGKTVARWRYAIPSKDDGVYDALEDDVDCDSYAEALALFAQLTGVALKDQTK